MSTPNELYDEATDRRDRVTSPVRSPSWRRRSRSIPGSRSGTACSPNSMPIWPGREGDRARQESRRARARRRFQLTRHSRSSTSAAGGSPRPSTPRPWPIKSKWDSIDRSENDELSELSGCEDCTMRQAGKAAKNSPGVHLFFAAVLPIFGSISLLGSACERGRAACPPIPGSPSI